MASSLLNPSSIAMVICLLVGYVDKLFTELWKIVEKPSSVKTMRVTSPPLCSEFEQPDKKNAIEKHKSRFSHSQ